LLAVLVVAFYACKKEETIDNSLVGYWSLSQELNDPGDGSGQWRPTAHTGAFVRFRSDSSFASNVATLSAFDRFSVIGSSITFYQAGGTALRRTTFVMNDSQLDLEGNCIERCAMRFSKN